MMNDLTLLNITLTLFLIMDPIGNIASFLTMMRDIDPKRVKYIVMREMLIALAVMFAFNYLGEFIFTFLELDHVSVRIASGLILFLVAIKFLFPSSSNLRANIVPGEPFIIPLAIPLVAGPALLATIMLYANMETCQPLMLTAILIAWMVSCIILMLAPVLYRCLGKNGLVACERLLAMVLVMLAIQRFMEGVQQFIQQAK